MSRKSKIAFEIKVKCVKVYLTGKKVANDRGYQYTSKTFKLKLYKVYATWSMSRVGRCIDNGPIEYRTQILVA